MRGIAVFVVVALAAIALFLLGVFTEQAYSKRTREVACWKWES